MATVQQIKDAINNANTLGRTNLTDKGVSVSDAATTYEIMSKIAEIPSGGASISVSSEVSGIFLPVSVHTTSVSITSNISAESSATLNE